MKYLFLISFLTFLLSCGEEKIVYVYEDNINKNPYDTAISLGVFTVARIANYNLDIRNNPTLKVKFDSLYVLEREKRGLYSFDTVPLAYIKIETLEEFNQFYSSIIFKNREDAPRYTDSILSFRKPDFSKEDVIITVFTQIRDRGTTYNYYVDQEYFRFRNSREVLIWRKVFEVRYNNYFDVRTTTQYFIVDYIPKEINYNGGRIIETSTPFLLFVD